MKRIVLLFVLAFTVAAHAQTHIQDYPTAPNIPIVCAQNAVQYSQIASYLTAVGIYETNVSVPLIKAATSHPQFEVAFAGYLNLNQAVTSFISSCFTTAAIPIPNPGCTVNVSGTDSDITPSALSEKVYAFDVIQGANYLLGFFTTGQPQSGFNAQTAIGNFYVNTAQEYCQDYFYSAHPIYVRGLVPPAV